jgi:hypothetical protein
MPLPAGAERVVVPLAERWRDVLPADEFQVDVDGKELVVNALAHGRAARMRAGSLLALRLPLPMSLRLRMFFENEADTLQEFVSETRSEPWPAPHAKPHARVSDDEVRVWYGTRDEASAALCLLPISRSELGL